MPPRISVTQIAKRACFPRYSPCKVTTCTVGRQRPASQAEFSSKVRTRISAEVDLCAANKKHEPSSGSTWKAPPTPLINFIAMGQARYAARLCFNSEAILKRQRCSLSSNCCLTYSSSCVSSRSTRTITPKRFQYRFIRNSVVTWESSW